MYRITIEHEVTRKVTKQIYLPASEGGGYKNVEVKETKFEKEFEQVKNFVNVDALVCHINQ